MPDIPWAAVQYFKIKHRHTLISVFLDFEAFFCFRLTLLVKSNEAYDKYAARCRLLHLSARCSTSKQDTLFTR